MDPHMEPLHPAKRPHTVSPVGSSSSRVSPGTPSFGGSTGGGYPHMGGPIRLEDISMSREMRERERQERERAERERMERQERERHFNYNSEYIFVAQAMLSLKT